VGYVPTTITAEDLWDASFVEYARQFLP